MAMSDSFSNEVRISHPDPMMMQKYCDGYNKGDVGGHLFPPPPPDLLSNREENSYYLWQEEWQFYMGREYGEGQLSPNKDGSVYNYVETRREPPLEFYNKLLEFGFHVSATWENIDEHYHGTYEDGEYEDFLEYDSDEEDSEDGWDDDSDEEDSEDDQEDDQEDFV